MSFICSYIILQHRSVLVDGYSVNAKFSCALQNGCNQFFATVSILSITAIAFDRVRVINHVVIDDSFNARYITTFALVWIISALFTIPIFVNSEVSKINADGSETICRIKWNNLNLTQCKIILQTNDIIPYCPRMDVDSSPCKYPLFRREEVYWLFITIFVFILPIMAIIASYYFIMKKVDISRQNLQTDEGNFSCNRIQRVERIFFTFFFRNDDFLISTHHLAIHQALSNTSGPCSM